MQRVFQLQQDGELAKAISQLEQLKPSAKYDQAYIARMLGIYYWQDEQVALSKAKLAEAVNLQAFPPTTGMGNAKYAGRNITQ
ncbi:TPR domain protein [Agarivorans albus MKT 106]|uniref:TPR domain protein n=1 Tax=Agarivorans albus MKT 106 TaxID=1331007 RepID=R9PN98_AGAAL|nr:TPR domain protein [Agarivorans albus MKT 106]